MTEEKAPMDADAEGAEAPSAAPPAPASPAKPGAMRPRPNRPPPPPPSKPSKLKGYLMLGIILTCLVLVGAIGYKLYVKFFKPHKPPINITEEIKDSFQRAEDAQKEIFKASSKVWIMGESITKDTGLMLQEKLDELRAADERFVELFKLMQDKGKQESGDWENLATFSLQVKLWILNAGDLLDSLGKPEYGGLYIPMYRTMAAIGDTQKELKEIQLKRDELATQAETDPALKEKTWDRIAALKKRFGELRDKLNGFDKYIKDGLAREDLSPKVIKELEELHDEAAKAQMSYKQAVILSEPFRK